jgi:hypothetical protein
MASAVYTRRSGLVVAEESADEAGLQRALAQLDPRLVLTREVDRRHGCFVWLVHVIVSDDRPAVYVCRWDDHRGVPLPLSSGLVERVREQLYRADRDGIRTTDTMNTQRQVDVDRQISEAVLEAARLAARFGAAGHSSVLPRGQYLRRARTRQ